jgi:uncharacterized protein with FMN-binding domain
MRRAPLIAAGTVAGIAGVLAFPTEHSHLTIPSAASGTTNSSHGSASTSSSTPSTTPTTSGPAAGTPSTAATTRSATSSDETYRYGDLEVTVTVDGTKITKVSVPTLNESDGRSASIDHYAIPQLERQVVNANSANIDGISGATFTAQAFVDGVSNALGKLGINA